VTPLSCHWNPGAGRPWAAEETRRHWIRRAKHSADCCVKLSLQARQECLQGHFPAGVTPTKHSSFCSSGPGSLRNFLQCYLTCP
jgi:hypothetical protein